MQLIAPDILLEIKGLSLPLLIMGLAVGMLLLATGWQGHRFWIVLMATAGAGVTGLLSAPANRMQPVIGGLLLAVAAGVLALALVRVVAFAAGGVAAWLAMHSLGPAGWDEPLICFVGGGLIGLLLFRLWTMVLSSFGGSVLIGYFGLSLAAYFGKVDAVQFAEQHAGVANWGCLAGTLAGVLAQFIFDRGRARRLRERQEFEMGQMGRWSAFDQRRWWGFGRRYRRAS
jgi:hypothetical protein